MRDSVRSPLWWGQSSYGNTRERIWSNAGGERDENVDLGACFV